MNRLRQANKQLENHFKGAFTRETTSAATTCYFIDHGLVHEELKSLQEAVRSGLQCKPLGSMDWQIAYLPLLVCTVEVGYSYEGNGTNFWPALADSLEHEFNVEDRRQITNWFTEASEKFGGVKPGESDWEKRFRHIAWPIIHAVLSKDVRRPFADCLRRFRHDVTNKALKDETITSDLAKIPTPVGSQRFRTWLGQPVVVAGIVRDLLGGKPLDEAGLFSKSFRDRLIEDLRNEPEICRAVRQVEVERKTKPKNDNEQRDDTTDHIETRFGEFFLREKNENGKFELCGEMPELPKSIQRSLKSIRGRWKVHPWGYMKAPSIPSDCLRSTRGHFGISFRYIAQANAKVPFFTNVEEQPVDHDAKIWLESVRFPAAEMLAFSPMDVSDDTPHCIGLRTPHRGKIWVVARQGDVSTRISKKDELSYRWIGEVEGGEIYEFDADNAEVRRWLEWPTASVTSEKTGPIFEWLRPSPVSIDSNSQPVYTTDDELGVSVTGDEPVQVVLRQGQTEVAIETVSLVALVSIETKGSYELVVRKGDLELESFSFVIVDEKGDGFIEPDPETPCHAVISHVDAGETELSRKDLFNRRLNLDIIGDRGIENLSVKLTLSPGDAAATVRLDRIPTCLAANDPIWNELSKKLPTAVLKSPCDLLLGVEIEGLSHNTWRLEAELQELWWEENEYGIPVAITDNGPFEVQRHCVIKGTPIDSPVEGDPFISVALDGNGNELHFDARVGAVGDLSLQRQLLPPKRFLRQMDDIDENAGLRTITQRYLQLSSASSSSLKAEVSRVGAAQTLRSWILHSVCGPNWIHKQHEKVEIESKNPVDIWWECQHTFTSLILPEPDENNARILPNTISEAFLFEFSAALPSQWWNFHQSDFDQSSNERINYILQKLIGDSDLYVDEDYLPKSLERATEILCGGYLADMLIPADAGDELLEWHVSEMSITDCASELHAWICRSLGRGRGRQTWTASELQTWLNLLLYPERLRKHPWETMLEKLLQDRPVARAGAFIAWRVEQSARLNAAQTIEKAGKHEGN